METEEKIDVQKYLSSFCPPESQPDPDFFQDDNDDTKIRKKSYSTTKVKARNLFTIASYGGYKLEDFRKLI